jgi:hypothetical protein
MIPAPGPAPRLAAAGAAPPDMAAFALAYAREGIAVFPIWPALPRIDKEGAWMCGCALCEQRFRP